MPSKKMVDLDVFETSGVDHPAHLHEGFAVMKSGDPTTARALWSALGKDKRMTAANARQAPAAKTAAPAAPAEADMSKAVDEAVQKAIDGKLQPILDQIAAGWKALREYAESTDTEVPTAEAAAPDAAAGQVLAAENAELLKAMPDAVRLLIEKSNAAVAKAQADAQEARSEVTKERELRLDREAISKSEATFGNLALNHGEVAPALRRLEVASPEVAKSITELLTATNAQLDGNALLKEFGTAKGAPTGDAMTQVVTKAQALVSEGKFDNINLAKAHVFETEPALAEAVRQEA